MGGDDLDGSGSVLKLDGTEQARRKKLIRTPVRDSPGLRNVRVKRKGVGTGSAPPPKQESQTSFTVCGEAEDGLSAIQKAKELQPDVIVIDLALPRLNGAEVCSLLKAQLRNVKTVAFSMYADELGKAVAPTFRIDAMLPKSLGLKALAETVERLLTPPAA